MRKLIIMMGIPIDDLSMSEVLDRLELFIARGRATGKSHQVATVNADFVVKAMRDPELRYLLQEADLATADGMPLVWGARLLGVNLPGRVTGADLIPALATRAAEQGYSMYLLGAGPGVAQRAAEVLQAENPGLQLAGCQSPPYGSILEMDPAILAEIKASRPDILLVAFGNPKQEKWIGMYGAQLGVPVMIGVGGTLDFLAGNVRRAPDWMQQAGLEWLYRLLQEPRRMWKRYVADLLGFSIFFSRQWWAMRRGGVPAALLPTSDVVLVEGKAIINVQGRIDVRDYDSFGAQWAAALQETAHLVMNLEKAEFLDSSAIGALVGLAKQARDAGGDLVLVQVPPAIQRTLNLLRLDRFFRIEATVPAGLAASDAPPPEPVAVHEAWTVYRAPRRLDAQTAPEMTAQCLALLAESPQLVIDFSDTSFLASAGLAALAELHRMAAAQAGEVRLAGCAPDVRRVLSLVRFDKMLAVFDDVAMATA